MTRVLETRTVAPGMRRRRYERANGTRYSTVEIPLTVLKRVSSAAQIDAALAAWHRGEASRALAVERQVRAETLLRQGVKPTAIAHELGVSDQRVRQWRAALRAPDGR